MYDILSLMENNTLQENMFCKLNQAMSVNYELKKTHQVSNINTILSKPIRREFQGCHMYTYM